MSTNDLDELDARLTRADPARRDAAGAARLAEVLDAVRTGRRRRLTLVPAVVVVSGLVVAGSVTSAAALGAIPWPLSILRAAEADYAVTLSDDSVCVFHAAVRPELGWGPEQIRQLERGAVVLHSIEIGDLEPDPDTAEMFADTEVSPDAPATMVEQMAWSSSIMTAIQVGMSEYPGATQRELTYASYSIEADCDGDR